LIASVYSKAVVRVLSRWRRPVVNVTAILPGLRFPCVRVDNGPVGQMAATHFLERGLRHFGYVGPPNQLFSMERRAAFCRALEQSGHGAACYHTVRRLPFDPRGQRWDLDRGVYRWLRKLPKPVGVFVPGDDWGIQVAEACRHVGLRVPEDVALLGVDDDDLDCELARPRLSSIILPTERIGYEAAALLGRLLAGEKPPAEPILLPPTGVATRRSTEILAIDDRHVVTAVRFIRENAHLPLRVQDVLREVPLGRRTLERRCHKALGWGLGHEIRRAHLERARRLLARTDLPMKLVARQAGFTSIRHMGIVFRQELGMPPTTYRRQLGRPAG
jgi:LacI family transcriptional regulator